MSEQVWPGQHQQNYKRITMKHLIFFSFTLLFSGCAFMPTILPFAEKAGETVVEDVAVEELEKYEASKAK